jgi:hypothetical protein
MNTNTPTTETPDQTPEETPEEREKLLSALDPRGRALIEHILENIPALTAAEAIEHTKAMGGL